MHVWSQLKRVIHGLGLFTRAPLPVGIIAVILWTHGIHWSHSHASKSQGMDTAKNPFAGQSFMCGYTHCPEDSHNHGKDSHEKPCLLCKKNLPGTDIPSGVPTAIVLPQVLSAISFDAVHFPRAQLLAPRSRGPPVASDSLRV